MDAASIDLVTADPVYNINRKYDKCDDSKTPQEYLSWSKDWMSAAHRVLAPDGSFWCAISDHYVSELDVLAKSLGFYKRGHCVWAFGFGVNQAKNFTRATTHWLYYTKHKKNFTFNSHAPGLRVPSARLLEYKDKRANPDGRLPDNLWVLRGQDWLLRMLEIEGALPAAADVWCSSRICGSFNARAEGVDNQLPEEITTRIVTATAHPGRTVLDPHCGFSTFGVSALKFGCNFIGIDNSERMIELSRKRLDDTLASL